MMAQQDKQWTNISVLAFAGESDPVSSITKRARDEVLRAVQEGWQGPPFDPIRLAEHMGISVVPRDDVLDARIVPIGSQRFQIEYNPSGPRGRLRFSIAHEIAHTLFHDCAETIRNRERMVEIRENERQLELLCNIAAAEFLMPVGAEIDIATPVTIDNILRLQKLFDVSTEAISIRLVKVTNGPCTMLATARVSEEVGVTEYVVDYSIVSRTSSLNIPRGTEIRGTILPQCTAVGYTAKGEQRDINGLPSVYIECVGIPPFPGQWFPRVIAIAQSKHAKPVKSPSLMHLRGDALEPRGEGKRIIAHIVNDKTPNWGAGFGRAIKKRYTSAQKDFKEWVSRDPQNLSLGNMHMSRISDTLSIVHMIAQHGYGVSTKPRIRYQSLVSCLENLAKIAGNQRATVHMPHIGTGYAGGNWAYILELVDELLVKAGIDVVIYTLPDYEPTREEQVALRLSTIA